MCCAAGVEPWSDQAAAIADTMPPGVAAGAVRPSLLGEPRPGLLGDCPPEYRQPANPPPLTRSLLCTVFYKYLFFRYLQFFFHNIVFIATSKHFYHLAF